jgi:hypothetical protein
MGNAVKTTWSVETSHLANIPQEFCSYSLNDLRKQLQETADDRWKTGRTKYPFGDLAFRYEMNDNDEPVVVHASFIGKAGVTKRFMRLRRAS